MRTAGCRRPRRLRGCPPTPAAAVRRPSLRTTSMSGRSGRVGVDLGGLFQLLGVVEGIHLVEDLDDVAVEHVVKTMGGKADAMIRDPALREIVGADLLGARSEERRVGKECR